MYFIRSYIYILNKGRCKPNGNLICRPNIDTNGTVKRTHSRDILVPALHHVHRDTAASTSHGTGNISVDPFICTPCT